MFLNFRRVKRYFAIFADLWLVFFSVFVCITFVGDKQGDGSYHIDDWMMLPMLMIWFVFVPLIESFNGQTIGKMLLGVRVVTMSGQPVSLKHSLLRHALDPVDLVLGGIFLMNTHRGLFTRRIGDYIARTAVVNDAPVTCPSCRAVFLPTPGELSSNYLVCSSCKRSVTISENL